MSFGESIFLGSSNKNRFFNAIALTECVCLSLDKNDFDYVLHAAERKILNDKIAFISSIPEFSPLPRSKLKNLCQSLISI